jgi:limonene-1,2-epoxide hydrolase
MRFDIRTVVASGDNVVVERVDHLWAGEIAVSVPVVGVFTLSGDKISAWRDYFDPTPLEPLVEALQAREAWPA